MFIECPHCRMLFEEQDANTYKIMTTFNNHRLYRPSNWEYLALLDEEEDTEKIMLDRP